jgi:hypothetical protein
MRTRIAGALACSLLLLACGKDPAAVATDELVLAEQAQLMAREITTTTSTHYEGWLHHMWEALRHTDDPEAQACLAEARELHHQARAALEAGNHELARDLSHQAFLKVLCAVVEVFPDAPERTGLAADEAIGRIEHWLGDHDAPRIRGVLTQVKELRDQADAALADGDQVGALALNLKALQILHELVSHVREHHGDHGEVAGAEMEAVPLDR